MKAPHPTSQPPRPLSSLGRITAAALLALGAAACTHTPVENVPEGPPYVRGPVESITHHATASGMLVLAGPGSLEPCGIQATVDGRTRYFQRLDASRLEPARLAGIAVGDTVEVYVEGDIAESCPVQGYAATIVRVSE